MSRGLRGIEGVIRGVIRPREAPVAVLLFACFFLSVGVFQLLKPLKNGLFVDAFGADRELLAKLANILTAMGAVAVFGILRRHLGRRVLHALCALFAAAFLVLAVQIRDAQGVTVWALYLLGDLVAVTLITALWAFTTEIVSPGQARRLFGPIGAGAVLGGLVGVSLTRLLLPVLGTSGLLTVAAGMVAMVALAFEAAVRLAARNRAFQVQDDGHPDAPLSADSDTGGAADWNAALQGARLVARSRYLATIVVIMAAYEVSSQVMDYQFKSLIEGLPGALATQVFLSDMYLVANLVSVGTQFLLVGFLMRRAGLIVTLLVLPGALLASSLAFAVSPALWTGALLMITDNGLNYSVQQTGRETLFTVASRDEKYNARAFINVFVQRAAKGVGVLAVLALGAAGLPLGLLSAIPIGAALLMIVAAIRAGRHFEAEARRQARTVLPLGNG